MKVILVQDVDNLGEEGDVQDVADGYGRNYLIPKQLAVPFTKANQAVIESRRSAIEQRKEEKRKTALGLKQRLEEEELVLRRPAGDSGKLFGSVSSATVAEELERRGINIERKRIELPEKNIKMVGTYPVRIKLYDNEAAEIKIKIQPSEDEEGAAAEATPEATPVPEAAQEAVAEAAPTVEAEEGPADEKPAEDRATEEAVVEQAAVEETAEEVSVEAPEEGSEETPAEQIIAEAVTEEAAEEESVEETNEEE
jgi:large subunit ribosomal protein L9